MVCTFPTSLHHFGRPNNCNKAIKIVSKFGKENVKLLLVTDDYFL